MRLLAPAKINVYLRVGPPRGDGFHPLVSWMCTVKLFDILEIDRSPGGGIVLECDDPRVPCDASNLVLKAARAMADSLAKARDGENLPDFGLKAALLKRIPMGAGLGGGSSDGARMMQGLNRLWALDWSCEKLADLSSNFGSDLPFFFYGPSAICRGRGELVEPMPAPGARYAMLALPEMHVSTPAVYRKFDELRLGAESNIGVEPDWISWATLPAGLLLPLLVNDLEAAAFAVEPALGRLRSEVEQTLGRIVRMSGSGSSLFSLFDGREEAENAAARVGQRCAVRAMAVEMAPAVSDDLDGD